MTPEQPSNKKQAGLSIGNGTDGNDLQVDESHLDQMACP